MTRIKKTRKSGPLAPSKEAKARVANASTKESVKQGKGHKPGSRHSAQLLKAQGQQGAKGKDQAQQDPRHGSKKPVQLVNPQAQQQEAQAAPRVATTAPPTTDQLQQQLQALEHDQRLQGLLEQIEQGHDLNAADLAYVDACTERFQELADALGMDLDDDEDEFVDDEDMFDEDDQR